MTSLDIGARGGTAQAVFWSLVATLLFSLMFSLPKFAGALADPFQATWMRYTGGAVVLAMIVLARAASAARIRDGKARTIIRIQPGVMLGLHILRAACGIGSVACAVYAVSAIPLATANAIALTNGAFVLLFAGVFLGERLTPIVVFAGALSLLGGVIAAEPDIAHPAQFFSTGAIVAFAGAMFWGCETTLLKYTAMRDHPTSILMVVNCSAALMTLIPAMVFWREMPLEIMAIYGLMGPLAIAGQFSNIRAYKLAHASILVPVKYVGIIYAAIIGIVFFDETPSLALAVGATLIVIGGGLSMQASRAAERAT